MKDVMDKNTLNEQLKKANSAGSKVSYNKKLIISVYSSLQGLEKCVASSKKMFNQGRDYSNNVALSISEQERVMKEMRREANKLQIHVAQENWTQINRSLNIYYGLRKIIRPEIMQTFQNLATKTREENFTKPSGQTLH